MEDEVKTLKKHMGGLIGLVKDLKAKVEKLEQEREGNGSHEIKVIVEKQIQIDNLLIANSESISRIEAEMKEIKNKRILQSKEKDTEQGKEIEVKRCRYFNKGYCKYEKKCRYFHTVEICKVYLKDGKCNVKGCKERHPRVCKWYLRDVGCKRQNCNFLHDTLANTENVAKKEVSSYKCAGCKDTWQNERCVVKHVFADKQIYLCLNCDDWITKKSEVIKSDWTLLDGQGNLRRDV